MIGSLSGGVYSRSNFLVVLVILSKFRAYFFGSKWEKNGFSASQKAVKLYYTALTEKKPTKKCDSRCLYPYKISRRI